MRSRPPLAEILALALAAAPAASARKLYPVDEGPRDRSFVVFRRKLIAAARKHDRRFILSILDPHVQNSFGEDGEGIRDFKEEWELDKPHSDLWQTLTSVLSLGGAFHNREFWAPYVSLGTEHPTHTRPSVIVTI